MIETFSKSSKIWIFQSNKPFTAEQISVISKKMTSFLDSWQTHGKELTASFEIKYNQFIVVGANESIQETSGCSIDSLVHTIKELENSLELRLLDRSLIAFSETENKIEVLPLVEFKQKLKSLPNQTIIFNNTVSTVEDYLDNWQQPIHESWAKIYLG